MKKLFTLLTLVLVTISCFATDYKGNLTVTVQPLIGKSDTQTKETVISVTKQDNGKYTILMKDFSYGSLNFGDIELNDVEATTSNGVTKFKAEQNGKKVSIFKNGKEISTLTVDIVLDGEESGDKFKADIDIKKVIGIKSITAKYEGVKQNTTGISNLPVDDTNEKVELYNLSGQRISEAKPGQMVIEKKGGKAVKVVK